MPITIDLPEDTEKRLRELAAETGRDAQTVLSEAISSGLEDMEDLLRGERAVKRLQAGESRILSAEEAEKAFELDR